MTALEMYLPVNSFLPVLSNDDSITRRNAVIEFRQNVLRQGVDFGTIPGTQKETLLKPGAEKLCTLFGLTPRFNIERSVEDWSGEQHGGEPFFYYLYRCSLYRSEYLIAESDGSCNSFEEKYRYRNAQRTCPECRAATIIKGKEEYGGGYVCLAKKGGCGAKFKDNETRITSQPMGKVINPNVFDAVNTLSKMAQKRALIAACLIAVNASEFFTQDEDYIALTTPGATINTQTGEVIDTDFAPTTQQPQISLADKFASRIIRLPDAIGSDPLSVLCMMYPEAQAGFTDEDYAEALSLQDDALLSYIRAIRKRERRADAVKPAPLAVSEEEKQDVAESNPLSTMGDEAQNPLDLTSKQTLAAMTN